jgi:hypothetical protein
MIRHVFNDIQSTKTLVAIRSIHKNQNSIKFSTQMSSQIDQIQNQITLAEKDWAILMHHDAITGTHAIYTEPSYYKLLHSALSHLEQARDLMEKHLSTSMHQNIEHMLKTIHDNANCTKTTHHTIVNPSGYFRIQIMNFTIEDPKPDEGYIVLLQYGSNIQKIGDAFYADLSELHPNTKQLKPIRKLFLTISMQALSDAQVYVFTTNKQGCAQGGEKWAIEVTYKEITQDVSLSNISINVKFLATGELSQFRYGRNEENITEEFTYYSTDKNTRSGLYLFNPRHAKSVIHFNRASVKLFEVGGLLSILQVYRTNNEDHLLKTYIVNKSGWPNLMKQLFLEVQFSSTRVAEISMNIRKQSHSASSTYKAYVDDSMKLVERPIFTTNVNISRTNDNELNGYFTYAWVHGGILREIYKDQNNASIESFFGWANNNPIGCTFAANNEVDFMIFRSIGNNDYKGVSDYMRETHVVSTNFQFYIDSSVPGNTSMINLNWWILFHKVRANTKLNEPYAVFTKELQPENFSGLSASSALFDTLMHFKEHSGQVSSLFGEVDIVDVKLMRHRLMEKFDEYELAIVLRNR